jgi:hypothetical protein
MFESDPFRRRLQRLAPDPPTDTDDALIRVVRGARRRRTRARAGGILTLVLLSAAAVAAPRVLDSVGSGATVTTATAGAPAARPAPAEVAIPEGYVYEATWLPPKVYLSGGTDVSVGPPVRGGQWSELFLVADRPCPPDCTELDVRVLRGQPSLDAAAQARAYGGRVVAVRGREALLLPPVEKVRDSAALIWNEPSGLLVVIEGWNAEGVVTEQQVMGVAAHLKVHDDHGGRLPDPSVDGPGFRRAENREGDIDPAVSTAAPFPRALRHTFHMDEPDPGLDVPVAELTVYRGVTAGELRRRLAGGHCLEQTAVRGRQGWLASPGLASTTIRDRPFAVLAPPPAGERCSRGERAELVWNEHDDVTVVISAETVDEGINPYGTELHRRLAEGLRGR